MTESDNHDKNGNINPPHGSAFLPPKAAIDLRHVILVLSGKGGVEKSTVSVNLAYALAGKGKRVGLPDLDIHGPNIPKMLVFFDWV